MGKVEYFAYGSNMNSQQMKCRCSSAISLGRAFLEGYDFVYDGCSCRWKGAVANVVPKEGSKVWGRLYEIDESDLQKLDRCEGYPKAYTREKLTVVDDEGEKHKAWVYFRKQPEKLGDPTDEYRNTVIEGAKGCGLPEDYIKEKLQRQYGESN